MRSVGYRPYIFVNRYSDYEGTAQIGTAAAGSFKLCEKRKHEYYGVEGIIFVFESASQGKAKK